MKTSSVVLACLLLTTACSKVQELDKRTESMEKSTEKVSTTTEEMKELTSNMSQVMQDQYEQLRSAGGADLRLKTYIHMTDEKTKIGDKIADACVYMKAMEYQLWTDNELFDDEKSREAFYDEAASEFTKRLSSSYEEIEIDKMSPTNKKEKYNDELIFYAFAVSLHMNHHYQDNLVDSKQSKLQKSSMYDLVKEALVNSHNRKLNAPHLEVLVNGSNKQMMIDLLKARVDMLAALGLKNLTNEKEMTLGQKAKGALFIVTKGLLGSIDLPNVYNSDDNATNNWTAKYLENAIKTQEFLRSIGVEKKLEKKIRSAFKNIDFNEKKLTDEEKKKIDTRKEELKGLINKLVG